jgi:hypothetical protein
MTTKNSRGSMATLDQMNEFLQKDLYDALRWLFVGAVTWEAARSQLHRCGNQDALGMYTSLAQARALYEFYYTKGGRSDDARAQHFASLWIEPKSPLYLKYMQIETPANKRVFHLAYGRGDAANAGGPGHDSPNHLKNQVIEFAKDLRRLTEEFAKCAEPDFRPIIRTTLDNALDEAKKTADSYKIPVPL